MKSYTLPEFAEYLGVTYEEVYEDNISAIVIMDDGRMFREMKDTGELIEEK